jgi:uncharacterized protein YhjY with autotransporter beta-barrel domain
MLSYKGQRSAAIAIAGTIALSCVAATVHAGITEQPVEPPLFQPGLAELYTPLETEMATGITDLMANYSRFCPEGCFGSVSDLFTEAAGMEDAAFGALFPGQRVGYAQSFAELSAALRRFAPEELFALVPLATGFSNSQLSMLGDHFDATRAISRSRLFASNRVGAALRNGYAATTGAGGSSAGAEFSRFNLFFNASVGFGKRDDSTGFTGGGSGPDAGSEDAFDFDSSELSLGADWRFSDHFVAGGLAGYTDRAVDFDSGLSIAQGGIDARGFSALAFAQWDDFRWYANASIGYQALDYDTTRRVEVASEGGFPPSIDALAFGSPGSSSLLASLGVGVPFQWGAWGTDLFLDAKFQKHSIDGFSEESNDEGTPLGTLYDVGKQDIKSMDTSVGVKLQYVATPSFGVLVPFVRGAFHQELEDSPRQLSLEFQGLDGAVEDGALTEAEAAALRDAFRFNLTSDRPDKSYFSAAAGVSAVIRGSSRVSESGRGAGGLQCFVQYQTTFGLARYESGAITGGFRYEF